MKSFLKILTGLIVIALFNIAVVINANAGDYLGDFCWNFSITNNGSPVSGTIRLGINHIGGGHCTLAALLLLPHRLFFNLQLSETWNFLAMKSAARLLIRVRDLTIKAIIPLAWICLPSAWTPIP